jgi:hypothetical protein
MATETNKIINEQFKLPICFTPNVKILNNTIVNDLELNKTILSDIKESEQINDTNINKNICDDKPIYNYIFNPTNSLGTKMLEVFPTYYTTDTTFLKESQILFETISKKDLNEIALNNENITNFDIEETVNAWNEIKTETSFCEKYLYVDWNFAKFMNDNKTFLQLMSVYNIASPILSLCLPIFVLIVPFFIVKIKGIELNIKEYSEILRQLIQNHAIAKIFTSFHEVDFGEKIYIVVSAAFYLFSIYQNILSCIKFYSNMKKIHDYLNKFNKYLSFTIKTMEYHLDKSSKLTSYTKFNETIVTNLITFQNLYIEINKITSISSKSGFSISLSKITEVGHIMHTFYQIYNNKEYNDAFQFSFGFNGYYNLLYGLQHNINTSKMNKTTFINYHIDKKDKKDKKGKKDKKDKNNDNKPIFKKMYYPKFITEQNVVTNDCNLDKSMIITGPNASGKTTTLKAALINILLSQQIGFGCFESLDLKPYDNFHCYLNIPDTSGRDSLFQAEARRCKEIIDNINENIKENKTHFCIFDELYSGTNPEEAVSSAKSFMDYIVKNDNVTCLLTTHYIQLCKKLGKNQKIKNFNMKTIKKKDTFEYTYQLDEGISKIKGGIKVLKDMDYPKEILSTFVN